MVEEWVASVVILFIATHLLSTKFFGEGAQLSMTSDLLDIYENEVECSYRGEEYLVRDNGAVSRRAKLGKRRRPLDEKWTFGTAGKSDGYMAVASHKVHRIVATAFLGEPPSSNHVVDHIDTNRRNNRHTNLRWVTRLENILLNPVTAKRIEYLYGSIESFLADPQNPIQGTLTPDFEWMRTVSSAEAEYSKKRMLEWAASSLPSNGGSLGDWIYGRGEAPIEPALPDLTSSKTIGAMQRNWKVPAEFPLCPRANESDPLAKYYERLIEGATAVVSPWGETTVAKAAMAKDNTAVFLLGDHGSGSIKPWSLSQITFEDGQFVHESCGTFFTPEGAEKEFTLIQGLPWDGGDTFDDYC